MKYPYFRGLEADRYSFYRVPKALIKVDLFEKMSGDAKLLYAVLLDRMNLSLKNGWQDENGNAYIICTIDEIMDSIRCARQKAVKLLDELEHEYQLIERRRQGLGKPNLLYVKDLYAGLSQSNYWKYENQTSGGLKSELPGVWKSNGSKTDINNTDSSETDLIYSAQSGENISGEMREDERYRFYFQDKLEIPILEKNFPHDREILMEILELLVETVTSRKKFLRICGEEKPKEVVKSRLMKLDSMHMGYILAYTLNYNNHDGRYSHSNKEWADTTCKGERGSNIRTDWIVRSHPAVLNGFVDMYRKELAAEQQREPEKPFVQQFYVVTDLQTNPMKIEKFGNLDDAMSCYQQIPNFHLKALGVEKTPDPLPGSLDIVQCKNGIDTIVEDYKKVPGWDNPYIQNHVAALVAEALKVQDVAVAYKIKDGYFYIQISEDGYGYTLYNKDFTVMDGGIVETDEYRPVQEVMEEVLAEHGHSISECGVISAEYLQEQSYRAETQRAEAMKEKLAAEKPAPEASISFYVAECAEFPVMGEFHDNLTLEQALEVYDKIPAERMSGIKSIGFSLEDGSIYSGMFDLVVGGEVQAEIVNHIQHYRESPLVQKAISDMKTLLEKRQASKELEERPNTRQSVREALKNRKKAQEQQSNQEQAKPKKAKKKGEMEL